jgi:microsomal epoxide hydrolase
VYHRGQPAGQQGDWPLNRVNGVIVEKFKEWTHSKTVDRDQLLTNVMLYWLTRTAGSPGSSLQGTSKDIKRLNQPSTVPSGVAVFPQDVSRAVRRLAERGHHIMQWSEFDRGGHFPVLEVPDLLVGDLRTFFGGLR